MTSPRRKQGRPIESVALKITIRADEETREKIRGAIPSAVARSGALEVEVHGTQPGEVAEKARGILEKIRNFV